MSVIYSYFLSVYLCPFPFPGSHSGYHTAFSCYVFLTCCCVWRFLRLSWFLIILIVLRRSSQVFCKVPLWWNSSVFLTILYWGDRLHYTLNPVSFEMEYSYPYWCIFKITWHFFPLALERYSDLFNQDA